MGFAQAAKGCGGQRVAVLALLLGTGGCAALPVSGPTGHEVLREAGGGPGQGAAAGLPFQVVELANFASLPPAPPAPPVEQPAGAPLPTDLIGPGDVLDIAIYEAGVTLFAGARGGDAQGAGLTGGAQAERLGGIRVDDAGLVRLPYAGPIRAAGRTPGELALQIRAGLKGLSQNPQVVVAISQTIANSVIVGGEVGRPGRLVLATNRETLSDAVALAGGYRGEAKDLAVRVVRAGRALEYRLADVLSAPARDMRVAPGDRIEVLRQPFSFAVMGAAGKVEQMAFSGPGVSLAEAVAMAGGAHPALGDAKAVFVFRFVADGAGGEKPVVYHLDMMRGGAYFLSQRFAMRDKDLLFIGNAAANQPTKLIQLVSQLFTPIVAVESGLVTTGALR